MPLCRAYDVPLHIWFGGALRQRVTLAVALPLDAVTAVPGAVRRVVLASAEPDVATLIAQLDAAAGARWGRTSNWLCSSTRSCILLRWSYCARPGGD